MIIAGGMDGLVAMGTWITEPPSDPEAIPVVDYADAIAPILANPAQLFAIVPETVRPAEETAKEASTQAPACSIRELWPKPDNWPELHFDDDVIPWELKKLPQWLNWHPELRDGKITKIPTTPVAGNYTRTDATRASWDYDECRKAMAAGYRGYVGIGLSLRGGLFGIDLDHVIDPITRQLKTEYAHLQTLIDKVATYTEISPSGTGLHIYGKCENIPEECRTGTKRKENIEMYCSGRFLTISSMVYAYPQVLRNLTGEEYFEIYSELFGVTEKKQQLKPETKCKEKDDSAIITLLKTKDRKGKYIALWNGSSEGYDSPSEADFALGSQLLKLTGMNKEQAIRLFQKSERAKRDKLVNRPELIDLCIENALKRLEDEGYEASATTVRLASLFSGNNWQTEAAHLTCLEYAGRLKDIRDAGNGNYAVIDPGEDCVKLCATGREPAFRRWCNAQFPEFGYDPKFAEEMFREISELYTANPIPEIDITRPITAIRCLDGYISLKDGKRCDRPAEMEYCPFTLHLTAEEAELKPDYQPTGRVLSDLLTYVGESTTEYLLSVTAASIPRIPANRRVVMFTGPSRSFKTTYGMLLSELGLAPPRNVDFSSEVNGRSGQFRPELANNISQYPMLFVNDPHEPDGTTIKKLCDETQQYESKYVN
ncbi:MAG: hypothetical protein MJ014_04615, partial [Methanocorpusculum sp.]|nr:hypothetical protein [Methanocorpusculum sp.]